MSAELKPFNTKLENQVVQGALAVETHILTESEIAGSYKLINVLKSIHEDLIKEGYEIKDGKVYFEGKQVFGRIKKTIFA